MKVKSKLIVVFSFICILLTTSCIIEETLDEPTLAVSEVSIEFPKEVSEKFISISTNQVEWYSIAGADWIKTEQNGNELSIKVSENIQIAERTGEVLILAGGIGSKITVTQSGTEPKIVTIPDKLEIDQWGGVYQFDVDANFSDWTVSTDVDWISLTAKQFKGEVVVHVAENSLRSERIAKIILSNTYSQSTEEFIITQKGIMYYILPYLGIGDNIRKVKDFEFSRKSELSGQPDLPDNPSIYTFDTKSEAFDIVKYSAPSGIFKEAALFAKKNVLTEETLPEFTQFMASNGFTDKGNKIFFNEELRVQASVENFTTTPWIYFEYVPKQIYPHPTFDKFPYGFTDFSVKNSNRTLLEQWESENGGLFNPDRSSTDDILKNHYYFYDVMQGKTYGRAYFFPNAFGEPNYLKETSQMFTDINLVFWNYQGRLLFTEEFTDLYKQEGFEYIRFSTWHYFENSTKNLGMALRWVKYVDIEVPVIDIHFYPLSRSSSISNIKIKTFGSQDEDENQSLAKNSMIFF